MPSHRQMGQIHIFIGYCKASLDSWRGIYGQQVLVVLSFGDWREGFAAGSGAKLVVRLARKV
jgi:hypothetical protein